MLWLRRKVPELVEDVEDGIYRAMEQAKPSQANLGSKQFLGMGWPRLTGNVVGSLQGWLGHGKDPLNVPGKEEKQRDLEVSRSRTTYLTHQFLILSHKY